MKQIVRIAPELTEGFYDGANVGKPKPFTVEVGLKSVIADWPVEGWDGRVIEGQLQYVERRVILTPKLGGFTGSVVAYVLDRDDGGNLRQLFSGVCKSKGLK